nr:phosphoglycerate kinase [Desulfobulbaceae bacterium]
MKTIKDLNVTDKKVLMRVDFNVPFDDSGNITDNTRIDGVLPTIKHLLEQGAKLILCSHCGRPKGERIDKYSLAPVSKKLSELLGKDVPLAPDCIGPETEKMASDLKSGQILLLENLRFHGGETKNDPQFSKQLASLADIYINDAFAVSHRAHASVEGVTHYVNECAAGFLLQREIDFFKRSVANPERPLTAILGGAKVSSKLGAINNMLDKVNNMIVGGAMANTFLKAQGFEIGKSLVEDDLLETAKTLINLAKEKKVAFHLPVDCVVADSFSAEAKTKIVLIADVPQDWMILDIGPATIRKFAEALTGSKTIVWNGPMGAFEMDAFANGSLQMVEAVTQSKALSVVGGGDTNVVINKAKAGNKVSYMSTGGGAFLMLMEGKSLPGVDALG